MTEIAWQEVAGYPSLALPEERRKPVGSGSCCVGSSLPRRPELHGAAAIPAYVGGRTSTFLPSIMLVPKLLSSSGVMEVISKPAVLYNCSHCFSVRSLPM